jgi:hypothetical protein
MRAYSNTHFWPPTDGRYTATGGTVSPSQRAIAVTRASVPGCPIT